MRITAYGAFVLLICIADHTFHQVPGRARARIERRPVARFETEADAWLGGIRPQRRSRGEIPLAGSVETRRQKPLAIVTPAKQPARVVIRAMRNFQRAVTCTGTAYAAAIWRDRGAGERTVRCTNFLKYQLAISFHVNGQVTKVRHPTKICKPFPAPRRRLYAASAMRKSWHPSLQSDHPGHRHVEFARLTQPI
jgi:hypothetical protein